MTYKRKVLLCEGHEWNASVRIMVGQRRKKEHLSVFSFPLFYSDWISQLMGWCAYIHDAPPPIPSEPLQRCASVSQMWRVQSKRKPSRDMREKSNPVPFPLLWQDSRDVLSKRYNFLIIQEVLMWSDGGVLYYEGNNLLEYLWAQRGTQQAICLEIQGISTHAFLAYKVGMKADGKSLRRLWEADFKTQVRDHKKKKVKLERWPNWRLVLRPGPSSSRLQFVTYKTGCNKKAGRQEVLKELELIFQKL